MYRLAPNKITEVMSQRGPTLNVYRGAAPLGYAVGHLIAESNNNPGLTSRDPRHAAIGLMQITPRDGARYGYDHKTLADPVNNIYVWGCKTNQDARDLRHSNLALWSQPNLDFWLAVRCVFVLTSAVFNRLVLAAGADAHPDAVCACIQDWITNHMSRDFHLGRIKYADLMELTEHLTELKNCITSIDGANFIGRNYSDIPQTTPGTRMTSGMTLKAKS